jgi:hypothetical protein
VAHAFGIAINGRTVVPRLDLATGRNVSPATAITVRATAAGNGGVVVSFTPIVGKPVLNAIRIRKQ